MHPVLPDSSPGLLQSDLIGLVSKAAVNQPIVHITASILLSCAELTVVYNPGFCPTYLPCAPRSSVSSGCSGPRADVDRDGCFPLESSNQHMIILFLSISHSLKGLSPVGKRHLPQPEINRQQH